MTHFANNMHLLSVPGNLNVPELWGIQPLTHYISIRVQIYIYSSFAILTNINLNNLHKTRIISWPPGLLTEG